jgi:hypothetical protein
MRVVEENKAAKMRFPSGKSFADLVNEDLKKLTLEINYEEGKDTARLHAASSTAGEAGGGRQADDDLGV